jgi:hypothetical protein
MDLSRKLAGEALGTALLLAVVIGSGSCRAPGRRQRRGHRPQLGNAGGTLVA